jgi:hypothetical protein
MFNAGIVGGFLGVGISGVGVLGLQHMQARVFGGWNRVRITRNFSGQYRALIRERKAPRWPLVLYRVCFPLGIVIAFASLWLK